MVPAAARSAMPRSRCSGRLAVRASRPHLIAQVARVAVRVDQFGEPREQAQAQRVAPDQRVVDRRLQRPRPCDQRVRDRAAFRQRQGIAQPFADVLDQRECLGPGRIGPAQQLDDPVVDRARQRQQHRQLGLECAQRADAGQEPRCVEGQVDGKLVKLVDVEREPSPVAIKRRIRGTRERIARPALRVAEDRVDPREQRRGHRLREHEAVDQAPAQDADRDLLHAQRGRREDRTRRRDRRKADDAGGIARQQEHVRARRAVQQRDIEAQAEPQREAERQEFGRVDEVGHQHDRGDRAQHGSRDAEHRLRQHCARQRLRDDVRRRHRPIGAREADPQRDIISEQRCDQAFD
jgi:hypothetical protein